MGGAGRGHRKWGETTQRLSLHVTLNGGCWGSTFASCNGGRAASPRAQPAELTERRDLSGHRGQIGRFLPSQELQGPDTEKQPCQSEGSRNPGPGQAGGSEAWASQRGCGQRSVVRAGDQLAHEVPAPQKGKPRNEKPAHHNECPCLLQLEKTLAKQRTPTRAKK